jgi:hypothetical protein
MASNRGHYSLNLARDFCAVEEKLRKELKKQEAEERAQEEGQEEEMMKRWMRLIRSNKARCTSFFHDIYQQQHTAINIATNA